MNKKACHEFRKLQLKDIAAMRVINANFLLDYELSLIGGIAPRYQVQRSHVGLRPSSWANTVPPWSTRPGQ
jgi:hypothetical protein